MNNYPICRDEKEETNRTYESTTNENDQFIAFIQKTYKRLMRDKFSFHCTNNNNIMNSSFSRQFRGGINRSF
jgi:hypothetical protein